MSLDETLNKSANQRHYDNIADAWQYLLGQNFHWGYFKSIDESLESATDNLIDALVESLDIVPSTHLLDIGCGIGGPARYLSRKYGCKITGFSTSNEGIERARRQTAEAGLSEQLVFEVRDALDNQLSDLAFDSVILLEMSHLIRDKLKLLVESTRTLKVGGRISLCDLTLQRRLSAKEIVAYHGEIQVLERCFGKARLEPLDYYERVFNHCGLEDICVLDISKEVIQTLSYWRENAEQNRDILVQYVGDNGVDDFGRSCEILEKLYINGAWGYGMISGTKVLHKDINLTPDFNKILF